MFGDCPDVPVHVDDSGPPVRHRRDVLAQLAQLQWNPERGAEPAASQQRRQARTHRLIALVDWLAGNAHGRALSLTTIASTAEHLRYGDLRSDAPLLVRAGVLTASRGPHGGYSLTFRMVLDTGRRT